MCDDVWVAVSVGVKVSVGVAVSVGVLVSVNVGVNVLVGVLVCDDVWVAVSVGVLVNVRDGVSVFVNVVVAVLLVVTVLVREGVNVCVGVNVELGIGDLVTVGDPKLNSIDDDPTLLTSVPGVKPVALLLAILTVVGDGTLTGTAMLHDVSALLETPETTILVAPTAALTLPPHPLVILPDTVIGAGRVNV